MAVQPTTKPGCRKKNMFCSGGPLGRGAPGTCPIGPMVNPALSTQTFRDDFQPSNFGRLWLLFSSLLLSFLEVVNRCIKMPPSTRSMTAVKCNIHGGIGSRTLASASQRPDQCLSQDLDFSQKRSYLICLWSYLQKRGVIHSQRKLRDKARKLRERVRSLYILHAQNTKIVAS